MVKYILILVCALVSATAGAANTSLPAGSAKPVLPTCDQVVKELAAALTSQGFKPLGHQATPTGDIFLWDNTQITVGLILSSVPAPKDSKVFEFKGQCTGPAGTALIYVGAMKNQAPI